MCFFPSSSLKCNTVFTYCPTRLLLGGEKVLHACGFFAFSICHVILDLHGVSIASYGESVNVITRGNENTSGSD